MRIIIEIPASTVAHVKHCPFRSTLYFLLLKKFSIIKKKILILSNEQLSILAINSTNTNEKVFLFNNTILNILNNYILLETIICDDKDPPWFNSRIKSLIGNKNKIRKNYQRFKSNSQLQSKLNLLQEQLYFLINKSKQNYHCRVASKLTNVQRNSKTYWSLSNCFLNNKKIPLITPLFHENKFMTDFKEKTELFNAFIAKQCSLIKNRNSLHIFIICLTMAYLLWVFLRTTLLK